MRWLKRPRQLPLKWRLTLWYLLTLAVLLLLFAAFLYLQLRQNLLQQLDDTLQSVASQALLNVDRDGDQLAFQNRDMRTAGGAAPADNYIIYLTSADGVLWDASGRASTIRPIQPLQPGLTTLTVGDDAWRVYSQQASADRISGWVQVLGDLDPIADTLDRLLALMLVGGPLALALAGIGGVFLAGRALSPIDRMTRTAQSISGSDFNRRILYAGPADEVGRLAQTFDRMLDRLQIAFERERRFSGDAAHELRTPLAALKGRIGVTLAKARSTEAYVDTLREMEAQVDRLIRLSNDLLFMVQLDQEQTVRARDPIDLADFLGAVVDQIRPLAARKAISITLAVPAGLTLFGDMDLLIRLFLNLLDNAVKYTPENGRVHIQAVQDRRSLEIAVSDTGPGIAADHLPHLFERFYRVDPSRARVPSDAGGAGLGLAIANEIARAHGGRLRVSSQPGEGTTITAVFPRDDPASPLPAPRPAASTRERR